MLSEKIKVMRKAKGLSQQELAEKLNVVRQTVSKWEQGLSVPDADMLLTLSEVFETPVSTLLGETVMYTSARFSRLYKQFNSRLYFKAAVFLQIEFIFYA